MFVSHKRWMGHQLETSLYIFSQHARYDLLFSHIVLCFTTTKSTGQTKKTTDGNQRDDVRSGDGQECVTSEQLLKYQFAGITIIVLKSLIFKFLCHHLCERIAA